MMKEDKYDPEGEFGKLDGSLPKKTSQSPEERARGLDTTAPPQLVAGTRIQQRCVWMSLMGIMLLAGTTAIFLTARPKTSTFEPPAGTPSVSPTATPVPTDTSTIFRIATSTPSTGTGAPSSTPSSAIELEQPTADNWTDNVTCGSDDLMFFAVGTGGVYVHLDGRGPVFRNEECEPVPAVREIPYNVLRLFCVALTCPDYSWCDSLEADPLLESLALPVGPISDNATSICEYGSVWELSQAWTNGSIKELDFESWVALSDYLKWGNFSADAYDFWLCPSDRWFGDC